MTEEQINEAVLRILKLKNKLGLFEDPYRGLSEEKEKEIVFSDEHRDIARQVSEESMVLLKNENNTLPLNNKQTVALIGPFSDDSNVLGQWHWRGEVSEASQLADAFSDKLADDQFITAKGSHIMDRDEKLLTEALAAAEKADVIVLAIGEHAKMSGEAASRSDITLPAAQLELIQTIKETGKPIVVVLFNGRPLDLSGVLDKADAVLETWFLGTESGNAISNVLFGDVNPSGKLTMSFPQNVGQIPVYYNHFTTGRPLEEGSDDKWVSRYIDAPNEPLLPFGYGLSYTTFDYSDISLSSAVFSENSDVTVSVNVTNTGDVKGKEIVQFYVRDLHGEVIRPVKELKGFKKIELEPGETKEISFILDEKTVRYIHSDLSKTSDSGKFEVSIGSSSVDVKSAEIRLE